MKYFVLFAALLFIGATFYAEDGVKIDGKTYAVEVRSDGESARITSGFYITLMVGECGIREEYEICLESIVDDPESFNPYRYEIEMTAEKLCDDCVSIVPETGLTVGKHQFNITVGNDDRSVILTGPYYTVLLREGRCEDEDIYTFCLYDITKDVGYFYPSEHGLLIGVEETCENCAAYGDECSSDSMCTTFCVNNICRPTETWCGDGVCDDSETCDEDCRVPVNETNTTNTSNTTNATESINTSTTQEEPTQTVEQEDSVVEDQEQVEDTASQEVQEAVQVQDAPQTPEPQAQPEPSSQESSNAFLESDNRLLYAGVVIVIAMILLIGIFWYHRHRRQSLPSGDELVRQAPPQEFETTSDTQIEHTSLDEDGHIR